MENAEEIQNAIWERLFHAAMGVMTRYGTESAFGDRDFLINEDNYGWERTEIEIHRFDLFRPVIVVELRALLHDLPDWEITMTFDVRQLKKGWPPMGLTIRKHEMIDGLRRELLPKVFSTYHYPDSRPGTGYD